MPVRTRHPRLAAAACTFYRMAIWMYPPEFRRTFGHELAITFRNRVEDVLDSGGICVWLAFAVHIAIDGMRTYGTLLTTSRADGSVSLLGLSEGGVAYGSIDRTNADVSLVFAVTGFLLACVAWYTHVAILLMAILPLHVR